MNTSFTQNLTGKASMGSAGRENIYLKERSKSHEKQRLEHYMSYKHNTSYLLYLYAPMETTGAAIRKPGADGQL